MAVIAAMDIVDLLPWQSVQVYTVGAPRPGNHAFARGYSSRLQDTWHIINERVRPRSPVMPACVLLGACLLGMAK